MSHVAANPGAVAPAPAAASQPAAPLQPPSARDDLSTPEDLVEVVAAAAREGRAPLVQAAQMGRHHVLAHMLRTRATVAGGVFVPPAPRSDVSTAFLAAADKGHTECLRVILDAIPSAAVAELVMSQEDHMERTPLILAADHGHPAAVELLLSLHDPDAQVKAVDGMHWNALACAIVGNHFEVVKVLLRYSPEVQVASTSYVGDTALTWAAHEADVKVLKLLLEFDAASQDPDQALVNATRAWSNMERERVLRRQRRQQRWQRHQQELQRRERARLRAQEELVYTEEAWEKELERRRREGEIIEEEEEQEEGMEEDEEEEEEEEGEEEGQWLRTNRLQPRQRQQQQPWPQQQQQQQQQQQEQEQEQQPWVGEGLLELEQQHQQHQQHQQQQQQLQPLLQQQLAGEESDDGHGPWYQVALPGGLKGEGDEDDSASEEEGSDLEGFSWSEDEEDERQEDAQDADMAARYRACTEMLLSKGAMLSQQSLPEVFEMVRRVIRDLAARALAPEMADAAAVVAVQEARSNAEVKVQLALARRARDAAGEAMDIEVAAAAEGMPEECVGKKRGHGLGCMVDSSRH